MKKINIIKLLVLCFFLKSCGTKEKGLVITTEQLKKMDTLEFHAMKDYDSLKLYKDSMNQNKRKRITEK